jgi:hypothetical protein
MAGDPSAYAALGLKPGADAAEVERAYKKLIKQFHPDREGGDAERAAEINRAYRDLRKGRDDDEWLFGEDEPFEPRSTGLPWARSAAVLAVGIALLFLFTGPASRAFERLTGVVSPHSQRDAAPAADTSDIMNQRLAVAAVDSAVRDAVRIDRSQDEMALASASRDCHHELRLKPSLAQLDRCAAFDDAVIQLQDRDPLRDQGPFSELAVTGRLMSAGSLLSDDYLAIDSRLDRIRLRVELALAPQAPPEPESSASDDQR